MKCELRSPVSVRGVTWIGEFGRNRAEPVVSHFPYLFEMANLGVYWHITARRVK